MINIICFGDSITEGAEIPDAARWTSLLQNRLDDYKPGYYQVCNKGVDGNTSAQGFDRYWMDVMPLLPGILLIQFGFNDANVKEWTEVPRVGLSEYEKNIKEFHRIVSDHNSPGIFVINHTIGVIEGRQGNGKTYNENFAPYNDCVRKIAAELNASYIDLPGRMALRGITLDQFLSGDNLHLSLQGNREYAEMIFAALYDMDL